MLLLSTFAQLWDNPHAIETQWYIRHAGGDAFHITNVKSNKSLNVCGPAKHNGTCACFPRGIAEPPYDRRMQFLLFGQSRAWALHAFL